MYIEIITAELKMTAWGRKIDKEFKRYRRDLQRNAKINSCLSTDEKFKKLMQIASGGKKSFNLLSTDKCEIPKGN